MSNTQNDDPAIPLSERDTELPGPAVGIQRDEPETAPRLSLGQRMRAGAADPVLRILVIAAGVMTMGRGVFLTLTVLYFTLIVGLSAVEVAIVLTVASAVGAGCSLLGGTLADSLSARRLAVVFELIAGAALLLYVFADGFVLVLIVACAYTGANSAAHSVRSAIIARGFVGDSRVSARAVLRTVTNVGIAVGGAVAGIALVAGTAESFRITMVAAGAITMLSALPLLWLPARVNAKARAPKAERLDDGPSPFRDRRYLALTVLTGIFALHFALFDIGIPLWVLHSTEAPLAVVSVLLVLNTVVVIIFQIPLSRGTHDLRTAARVTAIAGVLMAAACVFYAASAGLSPWFAVAVLVGAAISHSFAEVLSSAGSWGLSFELANQERAGAYQGVFNLGWSVSGMIAPLAITAGVSSGWLGWLCLAAVFVASAAGVWWIARRAAGSAAANSLVL